MSLYQKLGKLQYSTDCYISSLRALNILDLENHTGDWHTKVFWSDDSSIADSHILGKKSPSGFDTNVYLGDDGIFVANHILKRMGVPEFSPMIYAANHARSIADLVLYAALNNKNPFLLIDAYGFDDFMEQPSDKDKVYCLLEKSLNKMVGNPKNAVETWLNKVRGFEYE